MITYLFRIRKIEILIDIHICEKEKIMIPLFNFLFVHDSQFHIGCQVFSHSGHKFLPHYQAQNKQQLTEILDRLEKNPFMKRCYNASCDLADRMKAFGIVNIEDFETFDIITQEFVQRKSFELLKILLTVDDEIFTKVCSEKQDVVQQQEITEQQGGEEEEQQLQEVEDTGETNQTEENTQQLQQLQQQQKPKSKYIYTIEIDDIINQIYDNWVEIWLIDSQVVVQLLSKFHKLLKKCAPASEYVKQYLKQHEYLQKEIQIKETDIVNKDERSKQIQALQEGMKLTIAFPDFLKINTLEHYKKYVTKMTLSIQNNIEPERHSHLRELIINLISLMTLCYISSLQSELDIDYYEDVLKLASNGQLALIISDNSICYGVNYRLNHVIVFDEMADKRSIGALFQLIGTCRVGVSWTANAYLGDKTFDRLIKYLNGQNDETER
ncbi:unnamed protein product [Paramecium pentaurelia]|uniref:Uncharacterized protein n=1 Tax=Paramecium pentaurelia TaxID=43138 RepID=A0A8S1ULT2_9CILI|nr:unnamed protein product [Paramecium pentaurelia]